MAYGRIAIDASKHGVTLHGADAAERAVLRRDLRRAAHHAGHMTAFDPTPAQAAKSP